MQNIKTLGTYKRKDVAQAISDGHIEMIGQANLDRHHCQIQVGESNDGYVVGMLFEIDDLDSNEFAMRIYELLVTGPEEIRRRFQ